MVEIFANGVFLVCPQLACSVAMDTRFGKFCKIGLLILCLTISGCASLSSQNWQTERKTIDIYDNQGSVKKHIIIKDNQLIVYDKDWKTKGYGNVRNSK